MKEKAKKLKKVLTDKNPYVIMVKPLRKRQTKTTNNKIHILFKWLNKTLKIKQHKK